MTRGGADDDLHFNDQWWGSGIDCGGASEGLSLLSTVGQEGMESPKGKKGRGA